MVLPPPSLIRRWPTWGRRDLPGSDKRPVREPGRPASYPRSLAIPGQSNQIPRGRTSHSFPVFPGSGSRRYLAGRKVVIDRDRTSRKPRTELKKIKNKIKKYNPQKIPYESFDKGFSDLLENLPLTAMYIILYFSRTPTDFPYPSPSTPPLPCAIVEIHLLLRS